MGRTGTWWSAIEEVEPKEGVWKVSLFNSPVYFEPPTLA